MGKIQNSLKDNVPSLAWLLKSFPESGLCAVITGTLTHTTAKGTKVSPIKIEKEVKAGPKRTLKQHGLAMAQKTRLSLAETLWTRPARMYHATFKLILLQLFKPMPSIF